MEKNEENFVGEAISHFCLLRNMSVQSLAHSVSMDGEDLRLSLAGDRKLTATELIKIMHVLNMSFKDFDLPA